MIEYFREPTYVHNQILDWYTTSLNSAIVI